MKDGTKDENTGRSAEPAKQFGEIRSRWDWVEASIWTDRMLMALETGTIKGKWFSLHDKAFSVRALKAAFERVKANGGSPGVDGWTISRFEKDLELQLASLSDSLMKGEYRPSPVKRVWIPKPGTDQKRPLGIPTVRDRIVQTALRMTIEPIFEKDFCDSSYGFRPKRSCRKALRQVWEALNSGQVFVLDADLRSFFDTIPHRVIVSGVKEKIADGRILSLIEVFLKQGIMDGHNEWEPEEGTPQGSALSPLLANIALHKLDVTTQDHGLKTVRYADDFVILTEKRSEAESALSLVEKWAAQNGLTLHPEKTRIVDYANGETFEFLGYLFKKGMVFPRRKNIQKLRDKVRKLTPRSSGRSLEAVIADLNPVLRGWFGYFKDSHPNAFPGVDGFVRRRLRTILGKRAGLRRISRGEDHHRWPNSYFDNLGLYSTVRAKQYHQPSRR